MLQEVDFSSIIGTVFTSISVNEDRTVMTFNSDDRVYKMFHEQDCCEEVYLSEIIGEIADLIGVPIIEAYVTLRYGDDKDLGSSTWTFYNISTINGYVTIRWFGTSNGYYSESVGFYTDNKIQRKVDIN